jgi:hypothetical protein
MRRRDLLKAGAALPAVSAVAGCPWEFGPGPQSRERLDQGPFDIDQDAGWQTVLFTTASDQPLRNPGLGLAGYSWEEGGPSLAARAGRETLEQHVRKLAALPFVDVLYIRCDWRNVQKQPGRLDLDPVWQLTLDAAREHGQRVAFRVQLSSPNFEPERLAMPDFVQAQVPMVEIGPIKDHPGANYREPRYDHPAFRKAFEDLTTLLAQRFDGDPLIEWVDLMQYGFWGEGHTGDLPNPFPDYATAERTFLQMTELQLEQWKRTPVAVNTQPDISVVGNRRVLDMAVRAGAWLRSDSIIVEEPIQIDTIANRPPWLAAILEDGYFRQYDTAKLSVDAAGVNVLENYMLHVLDIRANYWALWTEAENLARYNERYPRGFRELRAKMGYRVRPAWVWQRKRYGASELIVAVANSGVAGVPGVLWLHVESEDGRFRMRGSLDAGQPQGAGLRQGSFLIPRGYTGKVKLRAKVELRPGVFRRVAWCCEQPLGSDGSILVDVKPFDDPGWRKGV